VDRPAERDNLMKALGAKYAARVKSAEMLAVGWLETKLPEETAAYHDVMRVAHQVIAEAFSNQVIVPGVTTNEDVAWWMRQRVAEMGLDSDSIRRLPSGGTAVCRRRRRPPATSSSGATCSTAISGSSTSDSPPTRSTTRTCCAWARPTHRRD
jgi:hypothetical protein